MREGTHQKEAISEHEQSTIRQELERILESPQFRGSKRCKRFLTYVVDQTLLGGREADLKERAIAVEVFDRAADYDPNDDAIVRVTASEVRKRLAQYYIDGGSEQPVRIDLPAGSYCAEFHWPIKPSLTEVPLLQEIVSVPAQEPRSQWRFAIGAVAALLIAFFLGWQWKSHTLSIPPVLEKFWAPFVQGSTPVLMCVGTPVVYDVSSRLRNSYMEGLSQDARMKPFTIPFAADQKISGADLVPQVDRYAGFGNLHTAADLAALMSRIGKPWQVRTASDVSFAELRISSAILIGSESNVWTQPLTTELRFYFSRENQTLIRDRSRPEQRWPSSDPGNEGMTEDFAVVSRIIDSKTGNCLVFLGGRTQFGTQAAGELVTNADQLTNALRDAPRDWARKNAQLVIRTRIHGLTPTAPTVVATHFW